MAALVSVRRKLKYSKKEKKAFVHYFDKPKRKVGRPKKKTGKNKLKRAKRERSAAVQAVIDLSQKAKKQLSAQLDGVIAAAKRAGPKTRINWDKPENAKLRLRLAIAWEQKNDVYQEGDSFTRFCTRNCINRKVIERFIARRKIGQPPKKRGRAPLLSVDVQKHLCEGMCT